MKATTQIREIIESRGGLQSFSSSIRRTRTNRPTRFNLNPELKDLTNEELNVAFYLGLIGNNNRIGTIL